MKVKVHFFSLNDEIYDVSKTATLGPFEHVQMTYETLRDDTGGIIAVFDTEECDWQLTERQPIEGSGWADNVPVGSHFSDMEIMTTD